jgi:hypothetical protein
MISKPAPRLLRCVLWADAVSCLVCGALQVAFAGALKQWLGISAAMLAGTGEFLLLYGAAVTFLATRTRVASAIIWCLIVANLMWAVACVVIAIRGGPGMTPLGYAYAFFQAFTVAALAQLQYLGLRRDNLEFAA